MSSGAIENALEKLLCELGVPDAITAARFDFRGAPASPEAVSIAAASAIAAQAAGIAEFWRMRGGKPQSVRVDPARAAIPGLNTASEIRQNGRRVVLNYGHDPIGVYSTRDSRHIAIVGMRYSSKDLDDGLSLLDCADTPQALSNTFAQRDGEVTEKMFAEHRLSFGALVRSHREWLEHEQGRFLAAQPLVSLTRISDAPPERVTAGTRPLSGIRVLDMSQIIAGPVAARTLAEQGAQVLALFPPNRVYRVVSKLDVDIGKRSAFINLSREEDLTRTKVLLHDADVLFQSWRPGAFERRGLSPQSLAILRPGLVYVSISCYGGGGPWQMRGGYDEMAQASTGIAHQCGAGKPRLAPIGPLTSYLTGYLAAAGALAALIRRAREGGTWHVEVSLARSAMWMQSFGSLADWSGSEQASASPEQLASLTTPYGRLTFAAPVAQYSATPAYWEQAGEPLGASVPEWLDDGRASC